MLCRSTNREMRREEDENLDGCSEASGGGRGEEHKWVNEENRPL